MPPIAPIGLEYVAEAAQDQGLEVDVLDLCLCDDPDTALVSYFSDHAPALIGLSFRNVDDCFWPSASGLSPVFRGWWSGCGPSAMHRSLSAASGSAPSPAVSSRRPGLILACTATASRRRCRCTVNCRMEGHLTLSMDSSGVATVRLCAIARLGLRICRFRRGVAPSTTPRISREGASAAWRPSEAATGAVCTVPIRWPKARIAGCGRRPKLPTRSSRCCPRGLMSYTPATRSSIFREITLWRSVKSSFDAGSVRRCDGTPTWR